MSAYFATTMNGDELDVQLIGQYPRPVIAGTTWSWIGIVRLRTPHGLISRVVFFDSDGTMFWANNGQIDPYISSVQTSPYRKPMRSEHNDLAMV